MELACKDKIPFKTKAEAVGAAALARHRYGNRHLKPYKCPHCKLWHLSQDYDGDFAEVD